MEPNYGYKHTRGFIIFLVIIFCGWVIVAHSQVSNTGNLVGSTWNNGYSVPDLTCWGDARGSVNCSPGGTPYVRPSGAINFSYSFTELYQARAMADALPYSGAGLMVTGFQFNWMSKNGNYWDDARQDQLSAYVQMYSKGGQWIENKSYNLNFIHDWTNFAWTGTFSKERRGEDLGTILYGFMGKDNNYWLGPYGPEVQNVSFSLRYQPDPCVTNPLHSTDCPGFLKAIASPAYQAQESSAAITPIVTATTSTTPSMSLPTMTSSVVKLTARQEQVAQEIEQAGTSSLGMANKNANSLTEISLPTMSTAAARSNSRQEQFAVETETAGTSTGTANKNANSQNEISLPTMFTAAARSNSRQEQFAVETETAGTSSTGTANKNANSLTEIGLPTVSTASVKSNSRQEQSSQETDQTVVTSGPGTSSLMSLDKQAAAPVTVARVRSSSVDSTDSAGSRETASEQITISQTVTTSTLAQNVSNQTRSNQARDTSTRSDTASETVTLDQSLVVMPQTTSTTTVVTVSTLPVQPRSTAQTLATDNDITASTQISLFRAPEPVVISQPEAQTNYSLIEPARINTGTQPVNIPVQTLATPSQSAPVQEIATVAEPVRAPTVEIPAVDGQSSTVAAALIDRTNPLNDAVNSQQLPTQTAVFAGPAVKLNTADNDLAGGVSISQIARVPAGFDAYTTLAIREIAFYQPKEIYRGQRTVDNVRALRSLGQDSKHQEMINQQYRR